VSELRPKTQDDSARGRRLVLARTGIVGLGPALVAIEQRVFFEPCVLFGIPFWPYVWLPGEFCGVLCHRSLGHLVGVAEFGCDLYASLLNLIGNPEH
jgi:hypothetical protein